jgi:hypothetical protein
VKEVAANGEEGVTPLPTLLAILRPGPGGRLARRFGLTAALPTGPAPAAAPPRQTGVLSVMLSTPLGGVG